jgi:hypothetical protein
MPCTSTGTLNITPLDSLGMQMNGYIAGPFQVVLGTHLFTVEIYVAPIEEDMLLGLDACLVPLLGP